MANIFGQYSVSFVDYLGVPVSHLIFFECTDSTTLADLETVFNNYNTLLQNVSGLKGLKTTISVNGPIACWSSAPTAGDESEKTGLFNFAQTGSSYRYGVDVPGLDEAVITDGKIDESISAVTSFHDWFLSVHTGVTPKSAYNLPLASVRDTLITFRKHRRAENHRSLVDI